MAEAIAPKEVFELAPRLDLAAAEALHTEILERRDVGASLQFNASDVSLVDTPAIQVLLAAAKDQEAREQGFELVDPSPAFTEAMSLLGLEAQLNMWRGHDE